MNYGMPYKGSKNRIAESLISQLPPAKHFYDLFGGGGAMTHCALMSGKYQYIHYNELDPLVFKGFRMFINGEFKNETRWISREDFNRLKSTDPYAAICFSFSGNFKTYMYSKEIEPFKKAVHYSIYFNDNSLLSKWIDLNEFKYFSTVLKSRRVELQRFLFRLASEEKLSLKFFECKNNARIILQNSNRLERLNEFNLNTSNLFLTHRDFSDVEVEPDSVIYCDPPYRDTEGYTGGFNPDRFYSWARNNENIVYISEYSMPEDFIEIFKKRKKCSFSKYGSKITNEKLFTNKPVINPLEF